MRNGDLHMNGYLTHAELISNCRQSGRAATIREGIDGVNPAIEDTFT